LRSKLYRALNDHQFPILKLLLTTLKKRT
jgi:hypothetical protein